MVTSSISCSAHQPTNSAILREPTPTEAARPKLAATPAPRPEEPSDEPSWLPSELIAWTPFCAAVSTA